MNLNQLAIKHGSDKHSGIHDYAKLYEQYLFNRKNEPLKILEIGVFGGSSLKMWKEFFPNAQIVGIDINPDAKSYEEKRVSVEIGDQSDTAFLQSVISKHGGFDLIIDDGSHATHHHIISYSVLKNALNPRGYYVIEDLHTCYWPAYAQGINSIDHLLKPMIDEVQLYGQNGYGNPTGPGATHDNGEYGYNFMRNQGIEPAIEFVHFYKSIVFIKRI